MKHLYAQFTISDKDLENLYSDKLAEKVSNMSRYDFRDKSRGPDYIIKNAIKAIALMNEYKQKTQKFGVIEAKMKTDKIEDAETYTATGDK